MYRHIGRRSINNFTLSAASFVLFSLVSFFRSFFFVMSIFIYLDVKIKHPFKILHITRVSPHSSPDYIFLIVIMFSRKETCTVASVQSDSGKYKFTKVGISQMIDKIKNNCKR